MDTRNRRSPTEAPRLHLSSDFDAYWEFHIERDQQRLYPQWQVVLK
jgi:hypothetical protein